MFHNKKNYTFFSKFLVKKWNYIMLQQTVVITFFLCFFFKLQFPRRSLQMFTHIQSFLLAFKPLKKGLNYVIKIAYKSRDVKLNWNLCVCVCVEKVERKCRAVFHSRFTLYLDLDFSRLMCVTRDKRQAHSRVMMQHSYLNTYNIFKKKNGFKRICTIQVHIKKQNNMNFLFL